MPDGSLILPTLAQLFNMSFVAPVFLIGIIVSLMIKLIRGGI